MKKLLLLLLIVVISIEAMQGGKRPASAVPEMAATSSMAQKQKIEKEEAEEMTLVNPIVPPRIEWVASLSNVPLDVKKIIVNLLIDAPGATDDEKLSNAADNIRNLLSSSNKFKPLLDNAEFTKHIIEELAKRYALNDRMKAALALHTKQARLWLEGDMKINTEAKKKHLQEIIESEAKTERSTIAPAALKFIYKNFPELINGQLVMLAASVGEHDILDYAVQNHLHFDEISALQLAAKEGHLSIIEKLLQTGIKPDEKALIIAAENSHREIVRFLLQADPYISYSSNFNDALRAAAEKGFLEIVNDLLQAGADVNSTSYDGSENTALMLAAENNHLAVVNRLLEAGAFVNMRNKQGLTALMMAVIGDYLEVVKRLVQVPKINVNLRNQSVPYRKTTALGLAKRSNNPNKIAIITLLMDHGAVE